MRSRAAHIGTICTAAIALSLAGACSSNGGTRDAGPGKDVTMVGDRGPGGDSEPTGDQGGTPANKLSLTGQVLAVSAEMTPIAGATVRATTDADGDGKIAATEETKAQTDAEGKYRLELGVAQVGTAVVVSFSASGKAPLFRRLSAGPGASVVIDVALAELVPLSCAGARCALVDGSLSLDGLPAGAQGGARVFSPVADLDQFPGAFRESSGKLLISGGFAAIAIVDGAGQPLTTLPTKAVLHMALPRDAWPVVTDTKPDDDRIQVPLYAFDEVAGTWVAEGEGYLETTTGALIGEGELAAIRAGSYGGPALVRAEVAHLSYWNVDWPVETRGCLHGSVVTAEGKPAVGATVFLGGVTYTATFDAVTVGPDGSFCFTVLRSEKAGEDLDRNGVAGDQHKVALHVVAGGQSYEFGHFAALPEEGQCPGTSCAELGQLALSEEKKFQASIEGMWTGDWGDMLLRRVGSEYWGAYAHDQGTVVVRLYADGAFRGWWTEVPSRNAPSDAGDIEFRFAWDSGVLALDGRWRYGTDGGWSENWDLKRTTAAPPAELEQRLSDPSQFKRGPLPAQ